MALTILTAGLAACGLLLLLWSVAEAMLLPLPREDAVLVAPLQGGAAAAQSRNCRSSSVFLGFIGLREIQPLKIVVLILRSLFFPDICGILGHRSTNFDHKMFPIALPFPYICQNNCGFGPFHS